MIPDIVLIHDAAERLKIAPSKPPKKSRLVMFADRAAFAQRRPLAHKNSMPLLDIQSHL